MYPHLGDFPTGATIFFPFHTFNSSGASVTLSGLAVTDIEVYKGASITQRSSDAGYALVDTDGIDIDGITGIHGFTIDTSDNTDAGFYAAGNEYTVVVSAVTVDSQTVNFIAGRFSIERSGGVLALAKGANGFSAIKTDTAAILVDTGTTLDGKIDTIDTNVDSILVDTAEIGAAGAGLTAINLPDQTMNITGNITGNLSGSVGSVTGAVGSVTGNVGGNVTGSVGSVAAGGITASSLAADAITAAKIAADVTTELQAGLATQASVDAIDDLLDTEVAAIKTVVDAIQAKTDNLPTDPADASVVAGLISAVETKVDTVDTVVDGIKAKTDSLTFTVAGQVDANTESMNGSEVFGDGTSGDLWRGGA